MVLSHDSIAAANSFLCNVVAHTLRESSIVSRE
jgi:hypothetical protein